ncbi:GNAT family N-acetyltransferase [Brucepastera parasyntrophica]|uniref:GNAT family N-acetyltransferase n=1 Tax=Brucepastera parasyntrophica TaxID=2880008 RepID=UPI00210BA1A7|nr:GNAT family protein [Brucepastera parasyntrophica]ULQ59053.1 GNAT family N-acetyltransferase [Brucepastera parasyntrophica]
MNMIETNRLIIRYFLESDWKDVYDYLSKDEIYRYEPGEAVSENEAKVICRERSAGKNFLAVVLKETGKMIGHISFFRNGPEELDTWEMGFIFNPEYQNRGYCTEAVKKVIASEFAVNSRHKITGNCNPENAASWHVFEKAGMKREGHVSKNIFFRRDEDGNPLWQDTYIYGILNRNETA